MVRRLFNAWGGRWLGICFLLLILAISYFTITEWAFLAPHLGWRGLLIGSAAFIWLLANGITWGLGLDFDHWVGINILLLIRLGRLTIPSLWNYLYNAWGKVASMLKRQTIIHSYTARAISFEDLVDNSAVMRELNRNPFTAILGCDSKGRPILAELDRLYNVAIFGPVRSGKSFMVRAIVASLLLKPRIMDMLDFVILDLKGDLSTLAPLGKYSMNPTEAIQILRDTVPEMESLNELRKQHNVDWWHELPGGVRPKPTLIILDESQQMFDEGGRDFVNAFAYFTNTGAANGVVTLATGLYPRGDLFPKKVLANFHGKMTARATGDQHYINLFDRDLFKRSRRKLHSLDQVGQLAFHDSSSRGVQIINSYPISREDLKVLVDHALFLPENEYHWIYLAWSMGVGGTGKIRDTVRARLNARYPNANFNFITKGFVLDTLWHFVRADIACYRGKRKEYTLHPSIRGVGEFVQKWNLYVNGGGLERAIERNAERQPFLWQAQPTIQPVRPVRQAQSRIEQALQIGGYVE